MMAKDDYKIPLEP
jgi:tRNA (uracil-5-)-methyltransferase